jgi:hypothetical protein
MKQLQMHLLYLRIVGPNPAAQSKIASEIKIKKWIYGLHALDKNAGYTKCYWRIYAFPPAYFIDRVNIEEDTYNGIVLPKGSNLLFSIYEIHHFRTLEAMKWISSVCATGAAFRQLT